MSKFVIVGTQRSGTTMLVNSLNQMTGISCFGEILSERVNNKPIDHWQPEMVKQRQLKNENCYGKWLESNPGNTLSDFLDNLFSRNEHVGFKMLYEHYIKKENELNSYFDNNPDIKFILVNRMNKKKQAISLKLKKSDQFTNKFYVDPNWLRSKTKELEVQHKYLCRKFFYRSMEVFYEVMTLDQEICELPKNVSYDMLNFIEYEEPTSRIPVKIKKHLPSKIEDRVTNYKEIEHV